jgi:putative ABC transport system permease protein
LHIGESIDIALGAIRANKMRSALTLLGIIIGVMTIIAMQSLITGMRNSVKKQTSVLGANVFQVQKFPPFGQGDYSKYRNRKDITYEQAMALRDRLTIAENIGAEVWEFGMEIRHEDKRTLPNITLAGGTPEFLGNNSYEMGEGRFITDQDVDYNRQVAVIGVDVLNRLFPYEDPIGKDIKINGIRYEVVGVFAQIGSVLGNTRDDRVVIPITAFEKQFGKERSLNITIKAKSPELYEETIDLAIGAMRAIRKVPPGAENDFEIRTNEAFMEFFDKVTKSIRIVAIAIASISLLVAGVGIMNIMLVSVTERTREIGIRKSIGAKRRDVLWQFLIEAILLCELGGVIGILLGLGLAKLIEITTPIPADVPLWTVFLAIIFCSAFGMFFGVYPATKAARLDPIEALRFE